MQKVIDRDKFNAAPKGAVASATVRLFDTIQKLPKEVQLMALACAFSLMVRAYKFNPNDAISASGRLMRDEIHSSRMDHRFDAMLFHLNEDLSESSAWSHLDR